MFQVGSLGEDDKFSFAKKKTSPVKGKRRYRSKQPGRSQASGAYSSSFADPQGDRKIREILGIRDRAATPQYKF